ncbi:MAG TPA: SdpI family protein [Pseudonocardiaceae bacterium]|nr:SdpI family protein [Pseudonocardiaceae bacterium]
MTLRIMLLVLLVAYGVPLFVVGVLGWRQRLAFTGRLGVRTPAALRDEGTFALANRVAGLPGMVAGAVAVLGGIAAVLLPTVVGEVIAAVIGLVGSVVIARAGGVLGTRAAAAVPAPAGCGGGCLGCASVCAVPKAQPRKA